MTETLFGTAVPASNDAADGTSYVLGIRFTTSVAGQVTHGRWRFPVTAQNGGAPVQIGLYEVAGQTLLGSTSFPGSPILNDWNQVAFSPAIDIEPGTTYEIVVWIASHYTATPTFSWPATSASLTAGSSNGWFNAGAPALQFASTLSPNAASYFADVVFVPAEGGDVTTAGTASVNLTARSVVSTVRSIARSAVLALIARASTSAIHLPTQHQPGWYGLWAIGRDNWEQLQRERREPPVACPNDGEPLEEGPRGELHCRFDGWIWAGAK